jgi:tetratricopeptide (TPR) repeat protein
MNNKNLSQKSTKRATEPYDHTMKYLFTLIVLVAFFSGIQAQEQTAKLLQETARTLVQKGDYDNAIVILERAKQQEPNNIEILKDLCFASYLKRDFGKAIEVGKELVEKPDADEQAFQMLGLSYKATANNKEGAKLYRVALRKFPNSGVIYNEYAELFASENEMEEAITQWEKGIEVAPAYSSNYYNATMYYARKNNWIRAALYGEIFLNLESYSKRTEEIKAQLLPVYNNLLAPDNLRQLKDAKTTSVFEKNVLEVLAKNTGGKGN